MGTYRTAQGTLLNTWWRPPGEGNEKKGDECRGTAGSLCCTSGTDTTLQSNYAPTKICWKRSVKAKGKLQDGENGQQCPSDTTQVTTIIVWL